MAVPRTGVAPAVALSAGVAPSCAHVKPYYETAEICELRPDPTRVVPATLIDDAEDGGDHIAAHDGRDGHLYLYFDDATEIVRNPGDHGVGAHPVAGGANGSRCALNLRGRLADRLHPFAGLGLNMKQPLAPYDASRYAGVSFMARRSAQTTTRVVVKFPDWNTEPPGGCSECYNYFHREIVLEERWTRYAVTFDSLEQYPEWGNPRPEKIDATRLYGIRFEVSSAGHPFDVWIDDVAFVEKTPEKK
jgi:hypothetical protein